MKYWDLRKHATFKIVACVEGGKGSKRPREYWEERNAGKTYMANYRDQLNRGNHADQHWEYWEERSAICATCALIFFSLFLTFDACHEGYQTSCRRSVLTVMISCWSSIYWCEEREGVSALIMLIQRRARPTAVKRKTEWATVLISVRYYWGHLPFFGFARWTMKRIETRS